MAASDFDKDAVSVTDMNETNNNNPGAGAGQTQSQMEDLIGALKKTNKATDDKDSDGGSTMNEKKKKKKGKKGKKGKTKKVRGVDRYESDNYLLRIEGTICFAGIVHVFIYVLFTLLLLFVLLIWSGGDLNYVVMREKIDKK